MKKKLGRNPTDEEINKAMAELTKKHIEPEKIKIVTKEEIEEDAC